MILPIVAYGTNVLKKKAEVISSDYPGLQQLIDDMYETMYEASGVGLAAPQIGKSIRLFVIDGSSFSDDDPSMEDFHKTFINPTIIEEQGEKWSFNEGCLSIPDVREDVFRKKEIKIKAAVVPTSIESMFLLEKCENIIDKPVPCVLNSGNSLSK